MRLPRAVSLALALAAAGGCGESPPPVAFHPKAKAEFQKENIAAWTEDLRRFGEGDWGKWIQKVAPFRKAVEAKLAETPAQVEGLAGADGFLFFRRSLAYLAGGPLRGQPDGRDPFPAIQAYGEALKERGIDLLYVVVPVKASVYPEKLSDAAPPKGGPYVNPELRKLMLDLAQEADVECFDLLPAFLAAKEGGPEPVYQKHDTHWSHRTLRLTAKMLAERIRCYPWFAEVYRKHWVKYSTRTVDPPVTRQGDIVQWLPKKAALEYPPETIEAEQVLLPDGKTLYEDDPKSPIVLLGDSYAGVFHYEDCTHAGITAHLAKELSVPVALYLGQGMGPNVWSKLVREGPDALKGKKLIVWLMTARDLYNYRDPWKAIPLP